MDYLTIAESDRATTAAQWLGTENAAGVDLYIDTVEGQAREFGLGPRFVKLRVDADFLVMLVRRHALCQSENLVEVIADFPKELVDYGHLTDYTMWSWNIKVSDDDFTVIGNPGMSPNMASQTINTELLTDYLVGTSKFRPAPDPDQDDFRWHAGALFYDSGSTSMEAFIDLVTEQVPELAAKEAAIQLEMLMSQRLAAGAESQALPGAAAGSSGELGADGGPDAAVASNRRRRAGL